jgi:hypothetical protein
MKQAWSVYDEKLTESLKINISLLRQINLSKARSELQFPYLFEIFSAFIFALLAIYLAAVSVRFAGQYQFSIPGFAGVLILVIYLAFAIIKIKRFNSIDYFLQPVIASQKELASLTILVMRLRKFELILGIPMAATILPLLFFSIHQINIYQQPTWFIIEMTAIVCIGFPLIFWYNKNVYDKKLHIAKQLLSDIQIFEDL